MPTQDPHVRPARGPREYSHLEEHVNALSAAAGFLGSLVFAAVIFGGRFGPGVVVFAFALLVLHGVSTIYHAAPPGSGKARLRLADHCAIYVLIAGTYTPFALGPLRHHGGLILFAVEWLFATAGIAFKFSGGMTRARISNVLYLGMGWLGIFWMPTLVRASGGKVFAWLVAGGIAYSAGVYFYAARHRPYFHAVWHVHVILGSACHAWAVLLAARP